MRTSWILLGLFLVPALGFVFWFTSSRPARPKASQRAVTITSPMGVEGDVLTAARSVDLRSEVWGDVAVAGSRVTLHQPVHGYVLAAGAEVGIDSAVSDDVWALGKTVRLSAPVAESARLAGNEVTLESSARVQRDALLAGNTVAVRGPVGGNLKLAAGHATIAAEVGGSVEAFVGRLEVLPGAVIRGKLTVHSDRAPEISPEARVLGSVERVWSERQFRGLGFLNWLGRFSFLALALTLLGMVTVALSVDWPDKTSSTMAQKPARTLLSGLAGLLLTPFLCSLLAITIFGVPLALAVMALYMLAVLLSGVMVAYRVGDFLLSRRGVAAGSPYARLAAGALLTALVLSLPSVGWVFVFFVVVEGLGAMLVERGSAVQQRWHAAQT